MTIPHKLEQICEGSSTIRTSKDSPSIKSYKLPNQSSGRKPWYNVCGKQREPYVIGICGGSASGKTTVATNICQNINLKWVSIVNLDSFYKVLTEEQHDAANRGEYDFDSPNAIDFELATDCIKSLKQYKTVNIPIYDFTTHSRVPNCYKVVYGANVIIVEGLMTFLHDEILSLLDMKIFVETDADLRLCRRIKRDIAERGRTLSSVLLQYSRYVKPNFDSYIAPLVRHADIVVPWSAYNYSAVDMIVKLVKQNLENRGFIHRSKLIETKTVDQNLLDKVKLIKQTQEVKILHTIMRDCKTERLQFCNTSRRLIRLALLEAISHFQTNENLNFENNICTVSIMRAGEAFEEVVELMMLNYKTGRILIQHNEEASGEAEFHSLILPNNIEKCKVLLFDAVIASGSSAIMALQILTEHDVKQENIVLITVLIAKAGINSIMSRFPGIRIITTAIDDDINEKYHVIPGCGDFAKRFYNC